MKNVAMAHAPTNTSEPDNDKIVIVGDQQNTAPKKRTFSAYEDDSSPSNASNTISTSTALQLCMFQILVLVNHLLAFIFGGIANAQSLL